MREPAISFVVPARNDNYGGNFLQRMQVFLNCLLFLRQQHELSGEVIIVEWNPPKGKPRLAEALGWPPTISPGSVRIIEVPRALHCRLPNSDRIPMFEYIAKNVGIRRAKGKFVLATNADIVFSRELIQFLATAILSPKCFYRIDRRDLGAPVPPEWLPEQQLRFCAENAIRIRTALGTLPLQLASPKNFALYRDYLKKLRPGEAYRWFTLKFRWNIHTGAPGDFTLMSQSSWHELRGYPELPSQRHVDSYLCSMAKSAGLSQVVLKDPLRIYHQDHNSSEMARRPATDYQRYWKDTRRMLKAGKPVILNDETWGLGNEELPENHILELRPSRDV